MTVVDDLDAGAERLRAAGATITEGTTGVSGGPRKHYCVVELPFGFKVYCTGATDTQARHLAVARAEEERAARLSGRGEG